jgi:hypothetical protein
MNGSRYRGIHVHNDDYSLVARTLRPTTMFFSRLGDFFPFFSTPYLLAPAIIYLLVRPNHLLVRQTHLLVRPIHLPVRLIFGFPLLYLVFTP